MLQQIYVENFILIDNINLVFQNQLSAFTGETGAGKSLLIDAIGILKGDRISSSMVKQNKEKALIEGIFSIEKTHSAYQKLIDAGYDMEEDLLIISREFTKDGKSTSRINHRITTVSFIKEIISSLIDIHSQHDTQYLLNNRYHLNLLDAYCGHDDLLFQVKTAYQKYKEIADSLNDALQNTYNEDDLEFLTFQLNEIESADIKEGELDELEHEQKRMASFEKTSEHLTHAIDYLDGNQGSNPMLYQACRELENLSDEDSLKAIYDTLLDSYYAIDEKLQELRDYLNSMEYDEERNNEIQERIFLIHKLERKYGNAKYLDAKKDELSMKIDMILHRQDYITKQEKLKKSAYDEFFQLASTLQLKRKEKAKLLEQEIVKQLHDLYLPNARFQVDFKETDGSTQGIDKVEFMISMNPGEGLKPLSQTASGGELSRLMLGLKTIFTKLAGIETIIFDEIDTGVSGSVALAIGRKMKELSNQTQVFCVTHLAQVAACANTHYLVKKEQLIDETHTYIQELDLQQRIQELAMISSDSMSESAIKAAEELFVKAQTNNS